MSKNIWHKADIAPDPYRSFVINTDKRNIYTGIITNPTEWNPMILPEFYSIGDIDKAERAIRYAYLDDLIALETENKDLSDKIGKLEAELDRTRKALAIASDLMKIMYNNLPNGNRWKWEIEKTLEQIKITMQEQPNDN